MLPRSPSSSPSLPSPSGLRLVLATLSALLALLAVESMLEAEPIAGAFLSLDSRATFVLTCGGQLTPDPSGGVLMDIPLWVPAAGLLLCLGVWAGLSRWRRGHVQPGALLATAGTAAGPLAVWQLAYMASLLGNQTAGLVIAIAVAPYVAAISAAVGLNQTWLLLWPSITATASRPTTTPDRVVGPQWFGLPPALWAMLAVYVLVFSALNWALWFNLRIPHGDSAMYEEHLWNLLHGKGFRSYLDQGLFLGEHIQIIHLALLPVYVFWPSHLWLELAQSMVLASTAIPVYRLTTRTLSITGHSSPPPVTRAAHEAGLWLAAACLLSFPLQYLDIAIDLKTFRPGAFGIPALLFGLEALERSRYRTMSLWFLVTLSVQEDFSIPVTCVGLWLLGRGLAGWYFTRRSPELANSNRSVAVAPSLRQRPDVWYGLAWTVGGPLYLKLAMTAIHWFRDGVEIHYAGYFSRFGTSTGDVVWTILTSPGRVLEALWVPSTLLYACALLVPLAGRPLGRSGRWLTALPLFVLLCLNEIAATPFHHFHAPILPLLFWAAATERHRGIWSRWSTPRLAACCALTTGCLFALSPLSLKFWDPGSPFCYARLYIPDARPREFARIANLIPLTARVASTDFVHPRYTHHERSYDYSDYQRRVAGNTTQVPADTDYIVIDTQHPYSRIKQPPEVRELRESPDQWELLPDTTHGYFIVLKRKSTATP